MPVWRNGRRDRLKICYSKGCASSSLATGRKKDFDFDEIGVFLIWIKILEILSSFQKEIPLEGFL